MTFDDNLRCTDAAAFVTDILPAIGVTGLFAGSDFAFGRGRGGDIDTINAMGADIGITATAVPLLSDENSAVISSSRIRAALQAGTAARFSLARPRAAVLVYPARPCGAPARPARPTAARWMSMGRFAVASRLPAASNTPALAEPVPTSMPTK